MQKSKSRFKKKNQFLRNLRIIGYSLRFKNNFDIQKNEKFLIKAFQRRFRQELINGKIDKECLIIAEKMSKLYK